MRLALLQLNQIVGDLAGNAQRIASAVREAERQNAIFCITPEMSLTGYPPRDLLLNSGFVNRAWETADALAHELADGPQVLVGLPERNAAAEGRPLFNAAALLSRGSVEARFRKALLPTYDVFDEDRYFEPWRGAQLMELDGDVFALSICEDIWNDRDFWKRRRYHRDPIDEARQAGARILINMSASPFEAGKQQLRESMIGSLARSQALVTVYVNQVGGNDDLVFDGRSSVFDADGTLLARAAAFREDVLVIDVGAGPGRIEADLTAEEEEIHAALVLGTRDYARKCGFTRVLLGLSGGIDSALTAAIAAEAFGPECVLGVLMPSPFSSAGSIDDALALASNLGVRTETLAIEAIMAAFDRTLEPVFQDRPRDVTEENIQARIRGNLLMALANKTGALLLTTGNKSELAVGYCTLYGDMSGGLAVIADVPKTMVYRLSRWVNRSREIIPAATITKPPSAELRPGQTDQDSLPPYDVLDAILERYIERHEPLEQIVAAGFEESTVRRVLHLVRVAEFKRKQAAPGLKVTDRAFGSGWRMPIARGDWENARVRPRD